MLVLDCNFTFLLTLQSNTLFIRDFEQKAICKVLNISYEQLFENTDKYFD